MRINRFLKASSSSGNALIIILVGVALFAALLFAMTQNRTTFIKQIATEEARLNAGEMIQYGDSLRLIIDKMMTVNNVLESNSSGNGILFSADEAHAAYGAPGDQPTTELFNKNGGGAPYKTPPQDACASGCSYEFTGQIRVTDVNTAKYELSMVVAGLTQEACELINAIQKNGWSSVPTGGALTLLRFDGTNYGDTGGGNAFSLTGAGNEFVGLKSFCYQESGGGQRYIFVHVLHGR